MIPLARWLQERDANGSTSVLPAEMPEEDDLKSDPYEVGVVAGPDPQLQDLEERLAAAIRECEAQAVAAQRREAELLQRLGADAVARLQEDVKVGLAEIQMTIEAAVTDVLLPFLGSKSTERVRQELAELLRQAIRNSSEPLLEVRAPMQLHDFLVAEAEGWGMAVTVTEASSIDLIFDSRSERFEELTTHWRGIIAGSNA